MVWCAAYFVFIFNVCQWTVRKKNKIYCPKELFAISLKLIFFFTSYSWMRLLFSLSNCNLIFCTVFATIRPLFFPWFFQTTLWQKKKSHFNGLYVVLINGKVKPYWPLVEPKTNPFVFFWYDFWLSAYFFPMKEFIAHKSYVNTWISI